MSGVNVYSNPSIETEFCDLVQNNVGFSTQYR